MGAWLQNCAVRVEHPVVHGRQDPGARRDGVHVHRAGGDVDTWASCQKDSGIDIQSLEGARLQGLTAVGVRGSWQVKLLQEAGIDTVEADDQETCARMLLAGRVDVWITSQLQASVVLENIDAEQSSVEPVFIHRRSPSYLMVSNGTDPELLQKWQDAFDELKNSGALHTVAEEWSEQLGIPLIMIRKKAFRRKTMLSIPLAEPQ
jgi:polar amino acid transport system substrate-binding protein